MRPIIPAFLLAATLGALPATAGSEGEGRYEPAGEPPATAGAEPGHPSASVAAGSGAETPSAPGRMLDREELIRTVLARNPSLAAARQAWRAAEQREPQVSALADPMVAYGLAPLSLGSSDVPVGQTAEVRQDIPYPGKRRLRGAAARSEAEAAAHEHEALRVELAAFASQLFDDLALGYRALEINRQHQELVEEFQAIATARYAAGLASQQAPLGAEAELAHLVHEEAGLETELRIVRARINALLHRSPRAPIPPPPPDEPRPTIESLDAVELMQEAIERRPELRAVEAEIEARELELELARLDGKPDFGAMASYNSMWRETEHRWMAGVTLNLPVRRERIRAGIAEAEARLGEARSRRAAMVDTVRFELVEALDHLQHRAHVAELYRSRLLPAGRDQTRAALAAFRSGQESFLGVIEAERNLRQVELGLYETLAEYSRWRAGLERAVGRVAGGQDGAAGDPEADQEAARAVTPGAEEGDER